MRKLIIVPTLHDFTETRGLASHSDLVLQPSFRPIVDSTDIAWNSIDHAFKGLNVDYPRLKVFAETLTMTEPFSYPGDVLPFDQAFKHADSLLAKGELEGRQERLIKALYEAGAIMMPTENEQLFNRALETADEIVEFSGDSEKLRAAEEKYEAINKKRDEFVLSMINESLSEGDLGVVIMGMGHDIISKLPLDIIVDFISPEARELWELAHGDNGLEMMDVHREFLSKREGQGDAEVR